MLKLDLFKSQSFIESFNFLFDSLFRCSGRQCCRRHHLWRKASSQCGWGAVGLAIMSFVIPIHLSVYSNESSWSQSFRTNLKFNIFNKFSMWQSKLAFSFLQCTWSNFWALQSKPFALSVSDKQSFASKDISHNFYIKVSLTQSVFPSPRTNFTANTLSVILL